MVSSQIHQKKEKWIKYTFIVWSVFAFSFDIFFVTMQISCTNFDSQPQVYRWLIALSSGTNSLLLVLSFLIFVWLLKKYQVHEYKRNIRSLVVYMLLAGISYGISIWVNMLNYAYDQSKDPSVADKIISTLYLLNIPALLVCTSIIYFKDSRDMI